MKKNIFPFLAFLLCLCACGNDDEQPFVPAPPNTSHISTDPFLGCTNHVTTDLSDLPSIHDFESWNNLYFFDAFDQLIVRQDGLDGSTLIEEDLHVRKFMRNGTKMNICCLEGIYAVDEDGVLTQTTTETCTDMALTSDGKMLFTSDGNLSQSINQLDENQQTIPYTEAHNYSTECSALEEFVLMDDNNIFAVTCNKTIIHFKDGDFIEAFGIEDYQVPSIPASNTFFLAPYQDDLIVVAKNGTGFYQIMKYTAEGEWIILKLFTSGSTLSQVDVDMISPSPTDVFIRGDKLYVSTTIASCLGIQEFDISKNSELIPGDYGIIRDPEFDSQCIDAIIPAVDGSFYVITLQSSITQMDCP